MTTPSKVEDVIQIDTELSKEPTKVLPDIVDNTQTQAMATPTKDKEPPKYSCTTPSWLAASVNKKWSLVLVSFPVHHIDSRYTSKAPKAKKIKSSAHITFDDKTSKSIAKVATYNHKEGTKIMDLNNFKVTCTDLGVINRETKEH
jgi:hypothetical protein